jgi:hypothetical protein
MRRAAIIVGLFVLLVPVINALMPVAYAHLGVTICHRTGSASNPYRVITPDNQSILEAHIGPIAHPPKNGNPDFLLPFPNGTVAQCRADDPCGDGGCDGGDGGGDGGGGDSSGS